MTEFPAIFESDHRGCSTLTHHRHTTPFVTIVLAGGYVEVNGAVPELCRDGAVVTHPAGEEHADRFESDTRCLNVEVPEDCCVTSPAGLVSKSATLTAAARRLALAFYENSSALPAATQQLYAALQSQRTSGISDRPEWLQRVLTEFPWTDAVPIRAAAAIAGLHETHFSRAFHRHIGITAGEYRARMRVRYASRLLLETTASISRVAANAGLADQSHLTRLFSARLGVSPAAYRQTFAR